MPHAVRCALALFILAALGGCEDHQLAPGPTWDASVHDSAHLDQGPAPDGAQCQDRCAAGAKQCAGGGFQTCGNYDETPCREWGPITSCPSGQKCASGQCQATCTNECSQGAAKCTTDGTGRQTCVQEGTCWKWGAVTNCPTGQTCSGGVCSGTCMDECAAGAKQCAGNGWQECGQFDADACRDWSAIKACPTGQTCSNGTCGTACQNECTQDAKRCAGTDGFQTCGDFDADPCLDWSAVTPCPAGQTCSNGTCGTTCQDECQTAGNKQCTPAGTAYQVCGNHDSDPCQEWGTPVDCPAGQSCTDGVCGAPCTCDFFRNVCEPNEPNSTTPCACDPDCAGGKQPCVTDSHCDTWCPADGDPDCHCDCQFNEYCEAAAQGSSETCACDPDCEPHDYGCMDDGHCDTFCPAGVDPDCGVAACRERWLSVGWRFADELALSGQYQNPDATEGAPWVLLSSGGWAGAGRGEVLTEFSADIRSCVKQLKMEAFGYDDSYVGSGAAMYLWNWTSNSWDLLPVNFDDVRQSYANFIADPTPYLLCGSTATSKCYVDAKVEASAFDNSHLFWVELFVFVQP